MSVRRVLVLGATGGIGRHVIEQAAATDIEVTALVRTPDKLPAPGPRLRVVTGDIRTDSKDTPRASSRNPRRINRPKLSEEARNG
ncbi:MAG: NAD(P)H-binding protein [Acidobacteria bacterium]|nr:NAD(P)H-binding protein [Acidobacteriota bacterium]